MPLLDRPRVRELVLLLVLWSPGSGVAQVSPSNTHLSIDGHPGQAPLVDIKGRKYVEVDDLARLTSGSISFRGDEIRLQLPGGPAQFPDSANANVKGPAFSKEFLRAGIEQMT